MDTTEILANIDAELSRLRQVHNLLVGNDGSTVRTVRGPRKKRTLSAEARARIAEAQRRRWAKQKKAAK